MAPRGTHGKGSNYFKEGAYDKGSMRGRRGVYGKKGAHGKEAHAWQKGPAYTREGREARTCGKGVCIFASP